MPKLSESKEWEFRFLSIFKNCMAYTFGKDSRKHPRHLQSYELKKTKNINSIDLSGLNIKSSLNKILNNKLNPL